MNGTKYATKDSIMRRAQELAKAKIPFGKLDVSGRLSTKNKGDLGQIIEEGWFGYTPNSNSDPDFVEAGVELKVSPYKITSRGVSAKERLVCDIINYMEEYKKTFETSAFWRKCKCICLLSYQWRDDVEKGQMYVDQAALLDGFPEKDLQIIKQDWEWIINMIRKGEAHLITEGGTDYLAACTKGANAESTRKQPFSEIPAMQRAYSLKTSYMTALLRKHIFGDEYDEHIIKDFHVLETTTFEQYLIEKCAPYYGKSQAELVALFNVKSGAKNLNEILLAKMLGVQGKIAYTDEFQKANIVPKTIRVRRNGTIKESMSFPTFDFIKLSQEESWEDSEFYNYIAPTKFLFVIFKENERGEYLFTRVKFWSIPNDDLEEVRMVWERTVKTLRRGVKLTTTSNGIGNDLPKQSENRVAHVRPHGRNGNDKLPLPDGRMMTKQCFWLNNSYIAEQIKD